MTTFYQSRRAIFLKKMLDAFDGEDSIKMMDLANDLMMVDFWPLQEAMHSNKDFSDSDRAAIADMMKELRRILGYMNSSKRTSVSPPVLDDKIVKIWNSCLSRLSPAGRAAFPDVLEFISAGNWECLDARYAQEIVEKLRKIITRIGQLENMPILATPDRSVQLAFEEAHRCYLYGFHKACAVLCRATVESSLREALKAAGYNDLADPANSLYDIMRDERARRLLGSHQGAADNVRIAGNEAVHGSSGLEQSGAADKVQNVLQDTRKVVHHLYALPTQ